ncbi:hypothetical protein I79_015718, partial [Cricetulus griseus]
GKKRIFNLTGVLSNLSAWVCEIVIANSQNWRLWEFDNAVVQFVSFGLWEAHYPQEFNVSGTAIKMLVHTPIDSTWIISPEFHYAQNLIIWAMLMKSAVLGFSMLAIMISFMRDPFIEMQIYCYKVSALVLCVSSLFTFVSVSWNYMVDLYGQTTFDFPPDFPVKKEAMISKHFIAIFPLGVLTSTMSLFGMTMFFSEVSCLKLQNQVKAQRAYIVVNKEA